MDFFVTHTGWFMTHSNGELTRISYLPRSCGKKNGYPRSTVVTTAKAAAWQESLPIL